MIRTLNDLLPAAAAGHPDQEISFLVDGELDEVVLDYRTLHRQARALAASLQQEGLTGQRLLLLYVPGLEFVTAFHGCLMAGAIPMPAYPPDPSRLGRTLPRLQAIAKDAAPAAVLTTSTLSAFAPMLTDLAPDLAALRWIASDERVEESPDGWTPPPVRPDDLAFVQYTSGSTAAPKGVLVRHANALANMEAMRQVGKQSARTRIGLWLPFYHDLGLICGVLLPPYLGCRAVLMSPIDFLKRPLRWLAMISRHRITDSAAPCFALDLCVQKVRPGERAALDLACWQMALIGAEPLRQPSIERFCEAFGQSGLRAEAIVQGYGLAEAVLSVSAGAIDRPHLHRSFAPEALAGGRALAAAGGRSLVSAGVPLPGVRVEIVDPATGLAAAPGRVGELWVQGPNVAAGYWNRPEDTRATFEAHLPGVTAPFLRTGDLGFFAEGELFVTGRIKDLIILRGANHYPQDLEQTVTEAHPQLRPGGAAAFAVELDGGEGLAVVAELAPGGEPDEVFAAIRHALGAAHDVVPARIALIEPRTLPKTSSGKLARPACRRELERGALRLVATWEAASATAELTATEQVEARELTELEAWLMARVAEVTGARPRSSQQTFTEMGLDSLGVLQLAGDLEARLGRRVRTSMLFDHPSVEALAAALGDPGADGAAAPERACFPEPGLHVPSSRARGDRTRIGVVGGGAAGLATAQALAELGYREITILERAPQVGGKVVTHEDPDGRRSELGQALFGPRWRAALSLAREVGLEPVTIPNAPLEYGEGSGLSAIDVLAQPLWIRRVLEAAGLTADGPFDLGRVDEGLLEPAASWLGARDLYPPPARFVLMWTACGYGYLDELPIAYLLRYAQLLAGSPMTSYLREGNAALWRRLAERLEARFGVTIHRGAQVISLQRTQETTRLSITGQPDLDFDEVVLACPPDQAARLLPPEDPARPLLERFVTFDYETTVFRAEGLPTMSGLLYSDHCADPALTGATLSLYAYPDSPGLYSAWQYSTPRDRDPLPVEALQAHLAADVARLGGRLTEVVARRRFRYFPHLAIEHLRDGTLTAIEQRQGRDGLTFVGSYLSFETVEHAVRHAQATVRATFPAVRAPQLEASLPLSAGQRRLWFVEQLQPGSSVHTLQFGLGVPPEVDAAAIERAFAAAAERHAALRTVFSEREGEPRQVILPGLRIPVEELDLRDHPDPQAELRRVFDAEGQRPFDLEAGPLLRLRLVHLGDVERVLIVGIHHLISDGWSLGRLLREIELRLAGEAQSGPPPTPFEAFVRWEQAWLAGPEAERQRAFWRERLRGLAPLALPPARGVSAAGGAHHFALEPALVAQLEALATRERASVFGVLLAAYAALLSRHTGQTDLGVGTVVAQRARPELADTHGFLVNTLLLRADLSGRPSFATLVARAREQVLTALDNQDLPYDEVVRALPPDAARVEAALVFDRLPAPRDGGALLRARPDLSVEGAPAKFDLGLLVSPTGDGLDAVFEYRTDRFDADEVARLADRFQRLLTRAVAEPDAPVETLDLLPAAERARLFAYNDTAARLPDAPHLWRLIEATADDLPEAIAVRAGDVALSYRELVERARALAERLGALGVGREARVGVRLERSLELSVAVLGVLAAGAAFVPIDPVDPEARVRFILEDAAISVLLTDREVTGLTATCQRVGGAAPLQQRSARTFDGAPDDLAYVIYTSGSTGQPKGALNEHRAVVNRLLWMQAALPIGPGDRVLQKTPVSFDVSVWELLWPLIAGAELVMAEPGAQRDPRRLLAEITRHQITTLHFVPSMLEAFLEAPDLTGAASLRRVISSGEALSPSLARRFHARLQAELHNLYGPTEAAIDVSWWPVPADPEVVPIGRPIANCALWVLDAAGQLAPIGVPGEIYIGGVGVGRGYLNRPELSAERFLPDHIRGEGRLFRTGDRGRWRPDGTLEFLGRLDTQLKLRGVRVEPGEVEHALEALPGVRQAAVVPDAERGALVGFVLPSAPGAVEPAALRAALQLRLPAALVPSRLVEVDGWPTTSSGKLDRRALARRAEAPRTAGAVPALSDATSPLELRLARLFGELLGVAMGPGDDFFEHGGHSLLALRLLARIRAALGRDLPLPALIEAPTPAALARRLEANEAAAQADHAAVEADAVFDLEIAPAASEPRDLGAARRIFVTGATGFLGAFLVRELARTSDAELLCLVRARDEADGALRLDEAFGRYGLEVPARVRAVPGDLERPGFGLAPEHFAALSSNVDSIVHAAAAVDFVQPYRRLRGANVLGTRTVLRLAATGRTKPLHHVSTVSVLPATGAPIPEDAPLPLPVGVPALGYAQSKWVAERLVQSAAAQGLPVWIHRLGRIGGDAESGASNLDDMLCRLLAGCVRLGAVPAVEVRFDVAPVDWVSRAVVHLAQSAAPGVFHLASRETIGAAEIAHELRAMGYPLADATPAEFLTRLGADLDNPLAPLLPLLADQLVDHRILQPLPDTRQTAARLSALPAPPPPRSLLRTYVGWLARGGHLPAAGPA